ncbi:MAG: PQQ-binding-like beta-propeller repeat protein [Methanomassiliicoccaceae archaeon]|nr:PQQ-binding-like beta-propeller repeat protein [Methanomassiliicoccaceae archaeon]
MQNSKNKRSSAIFVLCTVFVTMILLVPAVPASNGAVSATELSTGTASPSDYIAAGTTVLKLNEAGEIVWFKDLHMTGTKLLNAVVVTDDGFIAVGEVVAKFDFDGKKMWEKNLNPSKVIYGCVTTVSDGFVCVSDNDTYRGSIIITKFNSDGGLIWQKKYDSQNGVSLESVAAVQGGIVAAGSSNQLFFGSIAVKFDNEGNKLWEKSLSFSMFGSGFSCVASAPDGFVAVESDKEWYTIGPDGKRDRTGSGGKIVKCDNDGNLVWEEMFDPDGASTFTSVTAVSDGYVAVGKVFPESFGKGAWAYNKGRGGESDALIVKFDLNGNPVWWRNFGGSGLDSFENVVAVPNGVIAVGKSYPDSFGNGDWKGVDAKRNGGILAEADTIAVGYNESGIAMWAQNYEGPSWFTDIINAFLWIILLFVAIVIVSLVAAVYFVRRKKKMGNAESKNE